MRQLGFLSDPCGHHEEPGAGAGRGPHPLTPREREVLVLVGRVLSDQDAGRAPSPAEGTVKTHVSAIPLRLGLTSRVEAAILAYEAGPAGS
ncbi:DNA-binding NarL/FixJ family response regulator [Catenuloplanes nepalensis]|uniref:DNA-binding NarL/FixJ family response regulator n=1 Tax=Catenuloplanes nepalensis TaxID=587533 RepID=A0ABT9MS75_9ACTN|nr:LuxR C-terminal-related transcriptional regulator [Catenuloplanes nepalensis]MDP9793881.1 DNA-binding NarL/FixJ family response regulator [Catenuloplanes nepalensis]